MAGDVNWQDHKDIDRWANEHRDDAVNGGLGFTGQPDPLDELRQRLKRGDFAGKNIASVQAYVESAEAKIHRLSDSGKADREERAVIAAERSATWAGWAIAVSLAALALSAWPYVKPFFE